MSAVKNIHEESWTLVKGYCEDQIKELHIENEGDLDDNGTARVGGEIAMARKILSLADEEIPMELIRNNTYIE